MFGSKSRSARGTRLGAVCIAAVLSGCAIPRAAVEPEGAINVLEPPPRFSLARLPGDWVRSNDGGRNWLKTVEDQGRLAVEITSGPTAHFAVRRTDASLLATPFLSWDWRIAGEDQRMFPVRLVVGFNGGTGRSTESGLLFGNTSGLPPYDRAVALVWGESALMRGSVRVMPGKKGASATAYYVARGGRENAGIWWKEAVDLSKIYAKAWPGDDPARAQIVYIGVAAGPATPPVSAYVSRLRVSR